jgi:hypothetical protein
MASEGVLATLHQGWDAVRSLGLTTDYDAVWRDAFPDEPMPRMQA